MSPDTRFITVMQLEEQLVSFSYREKKLMPILYVYAYFSFIGLILRNCSKFSDTLSKF